MKLFIILTSHKGEVQLREGERMIVSREFPVDNDLSQKLLVEIEALFAGVGKAPTDIEGVEYSAVEAGFTTTRIGQVVANTFSFALGKKSGKK